MKEKVADWATREVRTVLPTALAREVVETMNEGCVRHLLVEDGRLLGMISNRDLVRVVFQNPGRVLDLDGCTAADIMTPSPLVAVEPGDPLAEAARLMHEHQVSALPVLDEGRVWGIITTADILRVFWQTQEAELR